MIDIDDALTLQSLSLDWLDPSADHPHTITRICKVGALFRGLGSKTKC